LEPNVSDFSNEVIDAAAGEQEVTLTTYGRQTGKPSDVTILIVTDGQRLFILSGQGMVRHWPQNLVARGEGVLHLKGLDVDVKARHVTDPAEARRIFDLYPIKYGGRIPPQKPEDPPRASEQATFELVPAVP
jgi:deazaflavin-dependent oxidoreductase (nitroreductase family)